MTLDTLAANGFEAFGWVHANERPGGGPLLEEMASCTHGGFVYATGAHAQCPDALTALSAESAHTDSTVHRVCAAGKMSGPPGDPLGGKPIDRSLPWKGGLVLHPRSNGIPHLASRASCLL